MVPTTASLGNTNKEKREKRPTLLWFSFPLQAHCCLSLASRSSKSRVALFSSFLGGEGKASLSSSVSLSEGKSPEGLRGKTGAEGGATVGFESAETYRDTNKHADDSILFFSHIWGGEPRTSICTKVCVCERAMTTRSLLGKCCGTLGK